MPYGTENLDAPLSKRSLLAAWTAKRIPVMLEQTRSEHEYTSADHPQRRSETGGPPAPAFPFGREETAHCGRDLPAACLGGSGGPSAWRERQPGLFLAPAVPTRLARTRPAESCPAPGAD